MVATAEPGSGKTLGYLVPAITHILRLREEPGNEPEGPTVLVLVPTRELALQVTAVCKGFHKDCSMRVAAIIGGVGKDQQVRATSYSQCLLCSFVPLQNPSRKLQR